MTDRSTSNDQQTHGGSGRGQGRHKDPGYIKCKALRFLDKAEEELAKKLTPRERVEVLLAYIRQEIL